MISVSIAIDYSLLYFFQWDGTLKNKSLIDVQLGEKALPLNGNRAQCHLSDGIFDGIVFWTTKRCI